MRILTVLGVMGAGLAIGTTAVLAPVVTHSAAPTSGWLAEWSSGVAREFRAAIEPESKPLAAPGAPLGSRATKLSRETRTIDTLVQSETAKSGVDAKIVESPWATQVTVAPESGPPRKQTSSKPSSDEQRRNLVRDIQNELRRVGCFDAEADGQWGSASKRAMAAFTERVNASLPFEDPDFILLTLVQGHKGSACGKGCPAGQGMNDTGRCTPNGILAHADRGKQAKSDRVAAANLAPAQRDDAKKDDVKVGAAVGSAWTAATIKAPVVTGTVPPAPVIAARPPDASPPAVVAAIARAAPESVPRPAQPLPGRMTIGGPLPAAEVPAIAARPKTETKLAATESAAEPQEPKPAVTQSEPVTQPAPRVKRNGPEPQASQPAREPAQARPKRAPDVVVHRPPPPPKVFSPPPQYFAAAPPSNATKSRRLVYEMFQRPDRN